MARTKFGRSRNLVQCEVPVLTLGSPCHRHGSAVRVQLVGLSQSNPTFHPLHTRICSQFAAPPRVDPDMDGLVGRRGSPFSISTGPVRCAATNQWPRPTASILPTRKTTTAELRCRVFLPHTLLPASPKLSDASHVAYHSRCQRAVRVVRQAFQTADLLGCRTKMDFAEDYPFPPNFQFTRNVVVPSHFVVLPSAFPKQFPLSAFDPGAYTPFWMEPSFLAVPQLVASCNVALSLISWRIELVLASSDPRHDRPADGPLSRAWAIRAKGHFLRVVSASQVSPAPALLAV